MRIEKTTIQYAGLIATGCAIGNLWNDNWNMGIFNIVLAAALFVLYSWR